MLGLLVSGCLSLDYTPIEERSFFEPVKVRLEGLKFEQPTEGPLLAGSAVVEITPPVGLPLAGYGGRTSTGIHDPVFAKALVFSNGQTTIAILSSDLLAITDDIVRAVHQEIQKEWSLPMSHLMMAATHTHSGPGGLAHRFWERLAAGPFNEDYFNQTVKRMAKAVLLARQKLVPSTLSSYRLTVEDLIRNRILPDGPEDPEVQVLVFQATDLSQTTYLINFSAHPTLLRSKNRLVSGDFPGFLTRALEENEDTIVLYTAGSVADQKANPPSGSNPFERAEKMGLTLARRILEARPLSDFQDRVSLSSRKISIPLPPPQPKIGRKRRLPAWIGRMFFDPKTELQIVTLNRILLLGIPGDLGSEIGLSWKKMARSRGNDAMIIGFANDYIGYIMPSSYYDKPIREAAMSFNGPFMAGYLEKFISPFLLQDLTAF